MRVLVSGATGYLGIHVAAAAEGQGDEVHAIVRPTSNASRLLIAAPSARLHVIDGSYQSLARSIVAANPDVVYHLASEIQATCPGADIARMITANIVLGAHICHALSERGVGRLVNAGTYWEYAASGAYAPNTLYAATKRALEDIALHYALNGGLNLITLVVYDIIGPGDWRPKMLPALTRSLVENRSTDLTAGEQWLDLVHVKDVAQGFLEAGRRLMASQPQSHELYALSSGNQRTLRSIVDDLCKLTGRNELVRWGAVPYPPHQIFQPIRTIPTLPSWKPLIGLAAGLTELVTEAQSRLLPA